MRRKQNPDTKKLYNNARAYAYSLGMRSREDFILFDAVMDSHVAGYRAAMRKCARDAKDE